MNSRKGFLSVVMLSAALLSACTSIGQSSLTRSSLTPSSLMLGSEVPYFISKTRVFIDADYIDRYACADGTLMTCERTSRISATAMCRCF